MLFGKIVSCCCSDDCLESYKSKLNPCERLAKKKEPAPKWAAICPPRYAHFELEKLPPGSRKVAAEVLAWDRYSKTGIALMGPSATGKSMIIHEVARLAFEARFDVHVTSSTEFAFRVGSPDNDERRKTIERCCKCAILLIDDIGKEKMTERVESDIYHVLEFREKWEKPVFFTANSRGNELERGMSEDRASPIVNRLRRLAKVLSIRE